MRLFHHQSRSKGMRVGLLLLGAFLSVFHTLKAQKAEVEQILHEVNLDSLLFTAKQLTGIEPVKINGQNQIIYSRYKNQTPNAWAAIYLHDRLMSYGYAPYYEYFDALGQNVVAVKQGTLYPDKLFIICAHYDAIAVPYDQAIGADDNASGCSAVMEAARLLQNKDLPFSVMFAFFDEEEQGLLGSQDFAGDFDFGQYEIRGVINLDMIAYDDNKDYQAEIHTQDYGNSVELANKIIGLNDTFNIGLQLRIVNPGTTASDHDAFWQKNQTAILLIEDDNDFNRYYHTKYDSITYYHDSFFYRNTQFAIASLLWFASDKDNDLFTPTPENNLFSIYPNPSHGQIHLKTEIAGRIEVYGTDGRAIYTQNISPGENLIHLDQPDKTQQVLVRFIREDGSYQSKWLLLAP